MRDTLDLIASHRPCYPITMEQVLSLLLMFEGVVEFDSQITTTTRKSVVNVCVHSINSE